MGNLTLNGSTSGQITLTPPAVAGTNTITLPAATGTVLTTAGGQTISGTVTLSTLTSPAATNLTIQSAGTTAMTIDTSQNVGIGTTSPGTKLDVYGTIQTTNGSIYNSTPANQEIGFKPGTTVGRLGEILFTPTNSASALTTLIKVRMGSINLTSGSERAYYSFLLKNSNGNDQLYYYLDANSDYQSWYTNSTERMRIDSSGNVGIGTTSPGFKLEVVSSYNNGLQVKDTTGTVYGGWFTESVGMALVTRSNHQLRFATNDSTRMTISAAGNVGIGFDAQASLRLFVKGSDSTLSNYTIYAQNSSSADLFYVRNDGFFSTGNAGSSPYNATTATAANVVVASNGQLQRSTSSLKYKTDVKDATHGLAEVLQLRPVTYKGKNDGDTIFGGLIAEEVDAVGLTEFVQYAEDGSPDALAYGNMVSLLVKAIQEQQSIISDLKSRIAALEAK